MSSKNKTYGKVANETNSDFDQNVLSEIHCDCNDENSTENRLNNGISTNGETDFKSCCQDDANIPCNDTELEKQDVIREVLDDIEDELEDEHDDSDIEDEYGDSDIEDEHDDVNNDINDNMGHETVTFNVEDTSQSHPSDQLIASLSLADQPVPPPDQSQMHTPLPPGAIWGRKKDIFPPTPPSVSNTISLDDSNSPTRDKREPLNTVVSAPAPEQARETPSVSATQINQSLLPSRILSGGVSAPSAEAHLHMASEDDGVGWVGPSNIDACRASGVRLAGGGTMGTVAVKSGSSGGRKPKREVEIACVTTDFTMQNVMLQMGIQVSSVDGMLVGGVRRWVLRCSGCFTLTSDLEKKFCPRCGASVLQRIAASVDARTGELKLHMRAGYKPRIRGTKYSIPAPGQQGRFEGEILLREDQLLSGIWRQKAVKGKKDISSAFGDDLASDVGVHVFKDSGIKIGLGRKNPNAVKGRERRGKKRR